MSQLRLSLYAASDERGPAWRRWPGWWRRWRLIVLALTACVLAAIPPKPTTWVTDAAGLLSPATRAQLEARLKAYRNEQGPDVVVWTAPTLPDEPRETWCFRTFNAWGIGRRGYNDGVVLFVFREGHKHCWITTGAGVTRLLTDAEAVRICREIVAPAVKRGEGEAGIVTAVDAILGALGNE